MKISTKERTAIDFMKAIFIVMVLYLHSYQECINLASGNVTFELPEGFRILKWTLSFGIGDIAVFGFFVISAYLLYVKGYSYKDNIIKKTKTLMIPYFMLNSFWIVFFLAVQLIPQLSVYFTSDALKITEWGGIEWLNAYLGITAGEPILYPLWFILNLFVLNNCAPIFGKLTERWPVFMAAITLALWLFVGSTNIFCLRITGICAWELGCLLAYIRRTKDRINVGSRGIIAMTIVYFGILIGDIFTRELKVGAIQLPIHRACILIGFFLMLLISMRLDTERIIDRKRIVYTIAKYSFGIYVFHEMYLSMSQKICAKMLPVDLPFQIIEYFGLPIIICCFCILFSKLLERFVPGIYRCLMGGR